MILGIKCYTHYSPVRGLYLRSASFDYSHFSCLKAPNTPETTKGIPAITPTRCCWGWAVVCQRLCLLCLCAGVTSPSFFYEANPPAPICWLNSGCRPEIRHSRDYLPATTSRCQAAIRLTDPSTYDRMLMNCHLKSLPPNLRFGQEDFNTLSHHINESDPIIL